MRHKRLMKRVSNILDEYEELTCKQIQSKLIDAGLTNVPSTIRLGQLMRGRFIKREVSRKRYTWRNKIE